jgi:hypothetical protein
LDASKKGGDVQIPKDLQNGPPAPLIKRNSTRTAWRPITAELDDIIKDVIDALKAPYK